MMIPAQEVVGAKTDAGVANVEAWCMQHRDQWAQWANACRKMSGGDLRVLAVDEHASGIAMPIEGMNGPYALLVSDVAHPTLEPWLRAIARLIGVTLDTELELNTMTDELVDTYDQLTFLYEIARMLSSTATLRDALAMLLAQARQIVGADGSALVIEQTGKAMIILRDGDSPSERLIEAAHRAVTASGRPLVANDPATIAAMIDGAGSESVSSLVVAPIVTPQGTATASCFGATKVDGFTAGNRKLMQAVAEQSIAIAGQFALQEEQIRRSRMERDLELAAQIQSALLPSAFPGSPRVSITAKMTPASEVGGDFYTHPDERLGEDEVLAFAIGDVAGKGVAAALITTMCLSAMRAEMQHMVSPAGALRAVQRFIQNELSRIDSFVTCVLATYDPVSRRLAYANAGHNAMFLWRAHTRSLDELGATGLPLGIDVGIEVEDATVTLQPHDLLLLYTDGVTEAASPVGELFGDDRLRALLCSLAERPPAEIRDTILATVRAFAPTQRDDITLFIVKAEA